LERNPEGGFEAHPFLATPFRENWPRLSPDDRFVAYISNESGQNEIYVQPFPGGETKWRVSSQGGYQARWSREGKELF
jgi:serine/threonine-protein kinase